MCTLFYLTRNKKSVSKSGIRRNIMQLYSPKYIHPSLPHVTYANYLLCPVNKGKTCQIEANI